MSRLRSNLRAVYKGDRQADRVVPPSGFTARLTIFAAGAMAFLAVFVVALALAADRLADRWGQELAQSATVRISAPADQREAQTQAAIRLLQSTKGVADVHLLTDAEQTALLAPWLGDDLSLEALPVPQLIAIDQTRGGVDMAGLRLRLAAEVPGAVLDDHSRWRAPLVQAADRLRLLGYLSLALITATVAAMVTLAANAALAANAQVIEVLRLVGATDDYIAQAFIRRFTLRALIGAAAGAVLGSVALLLLPSSDDVGSFLTGLGFRGAQWLAPLSIPVLAAAVSFLATDSAARRTLKELS